MLRLFSTACCRLPFSAPFLTACCCILLLTACTSQRSISYYNSINNPSYQGELDQLSFIKQVSSGVDRGDAVIAVPPGAQMMLIQSGQAMPDDTLMQELGDRYDIQPFSGIPSRAYTDGVSIRKAARSGGMDYILAYWGQIIDKHDKTMFIRMTGILVYIERGFWRSTTVTTDTVAKDWSFWDPRKADDRQVVALKQTGYQRLLKGLGLNPAE